MSRLRDKVPVEPLTPDRVANVERAVLAAYRATEPVAPRRSWAFARVALPLAAACAVVAAVWLTRGGGSQDHAAAPVAGPTHVVSTDTGSIIDLGEATVRVGPDTEIDIRRDDGGIQVALARGTVDCEVEPRAARPPFVVEAGAVDVIVVGTVFQVARDGDDVEVSVTRGKVRVDAAGASAFVAAGERWAEGAVITAAAETAPGRAGPGGPAVARADDTDTAGDDARADDTAPTRAAPRTRPRKPSDRTRPRPRKPAPAKASGFAGEGAPSIAEPTEPAGSATREQLYAKAWELFFRQHNPSEALAQLHYFERRFDKKGARTEDVLKLRIRIQCTKASSGCRKAAYRYLELYPSGDYRDQARALTNWM